MYWGLALCLLGLAGSANATLITWQLQGSTQAGATVTGSFEFDADVAATPAAVGNYNILVSGGADPLFLDLQYTPSNSNVLDVTAAGKISIQTKQPVQGIDRNIQFGPEPPDTLTDAGGTLPIGFVETRAVASNEFPDSRVRFFDASVTTVASIPEPGSHVFLALGMMASLALLRLRRS